MDKFATLEPVKLYSSATNRFSRHQPNKSLAHFQLIGRLPVDIHLLILTYLAVPDIPAYSRTVRALGSLSKDERVWEARWNYFTAGMANAESTLDYLEDRMKSMNATRKEQSPPTIAVDSADDEFGEFASVESSQQVNGSFAIGFTTTTSFEHVQGVPFQPAPSFRLRFIRAHGLLKTFVPALQSPPHAVLTNLFPPPTPGMALQSHILRMLSLYFSDKVKPIRDWARLSSVLRAAIDRFDDGLLTAFDNSDSTGDEAGMKETAQASWDIWTGSGQWELARSWADKRGIFYEQGKWDAMDNFTQDRKLDFDAMDGFMNDVVNALRENGSRAVRVFPPEANVLVSFAERLANEVVGEYISSLLTRAREISAEIFLQATAATFRESLRIVDIILEVSSLRPEATLSRTRAEDVVYKMFESNMDEYLDDEVEFVKSGFDKICRSWDKQLSHTTSVSTPVQEPTRFLGSHNPAQVKRNVLASFTNVLLLPVTIVPRTVGKAVGAAFTTGSNAAVQGIAMLNPQRWGAPSSSRNGYVQDFNQDAQDTLFEVGEDEETNTHEKHISKASVASFSATTTPTRTHTGQLSVDSFASTRTSTPVGSDTANTFDKLDLFLSLDTALELIHADRESLKRVEAFSGYPGYYGYRIRDTIEEVFILLLQSLGDRHIRPGFERATEQMRTYKPAEHEETTSVAPLLQFFELVHIGDTMQSMVQVYYDKELVAHIDRTDFLNAVVREKKRFEDTLDDCVAAGLNAGTDVLMNQVEHIIWKLTKPAEYCPPEDSQLELGPTQGCLEAIKCLRMHCQLLKGSTSKEVLEVFYQEIGIRLIAIIQKHLKRQIISLEGGFQVIADLNAYHTFISSLRVQSIIADFSYLKMLGHVYVVEDAKDLAQIVRDVTRYGGAYKPEDVYEFIQRRSDWKKIEKTVDKTMYNLSFKEDCIIC
ncbi:Exocyst complex component Sec10-like protein [Abortiporus biennis]